MESGLTVVTLELQTRPGEKFVVLLEAAAVQPKPEGKKKKHQQKEEEEQEKKIPKIKGTIQVGENCRMPFTGCPGGKTRQVENEVWEVIFPKTGYSWIDPDRPHSLSGGGEPESGRDAALREFEEETLGVWSRWMARSTVKAEMVTAGGYNGTYRNDITGEEKSYRSQVTVLHLNFQLPSEKQLVEVLCDFDEKSIEGLMVAEKMRDHADPEYYWEDRPEYRHMRIVPASQYLRGMKRAAEHLDRCASDPQYRKLHPHDGRMFLINTWPDTTHAIAFRKWDLYILMALHMPHVQCSANANPETLAYLEKTLLS